MGIEKFMSDNNSSMEYDCSLVTVMFADIAGFNAMSERCELFVIR